MNKTKHQKNTTQQTKHIKTNKLTIKTQKTKTKTKTNRHQPSHQQITLQHAVHGKRLSCRSCTPARGNQKKHNKKHKNTPHKTQNTDTLTQKKNDKNDQKLVPERTHDRITLQYAVHGKLDAIVAHVRVQEVQKKNDTKKQQKYDKTQKNIKQNSKRTKKLKTH